VPGDPLFGATKQGVVDMLQGMGGMWGGIVPLGYIEFNLPLAFRIPKAATFEEKAQMVRDFFIKKGFMELLRQEYAKNGLYFLDIHTYGPVPFGLSTKPVKTCDDLQGMKIKADGGNIAYHTAIGMQGTQLAPTETYMGLKLGTVDAAEWDVSAVLSGSEAQKAVELFFDSMAQALANGDRVEIRGFCTFSAKQYKSYAGRNPKTGERC
jgi:TRAP-type C4-dicarboxylate transport system substrate-binding protein